MIHIVLSKMSVHISVQCMFVFSVIIALGKKLSLSLLVRDLMHLYRLPEGNSLKKWEPG